jgi:hypothetical protein
MLDMQPEIAAQFRGGGHLRHSSRGTTFYCRAEMKGSD